MANIPYVDNARGTDCTGNHGTTGRTLTLNNSGSSNTVLSIYVDGKALHSAEFSHVSATQVITFNNKLWDNSYIRVVYVITGSISTDTDYCDVADVERHLQFETNFSDSTKPTDTEVVAFINAAEDMIDKETQHAWRPITVSNEMYDMPIVSYGSRIGQTGIPIFLKHRKIREMSGGDGDKIEVWDGGEWKDWVNLETEGRDEDYWFDYVKGILYLKNYYPYYDRQSLKMTYRYGETVVPNDIKDATAMFAAAKILATDDMAMMATDADSGLRPTHEIRINKLMAAANRTIKGYGEVRTI